MIPSWTSLLMKPAAIVGLTVAAILGTPTRASAQEYFDDYNGVWTVRLDGQAQTDTALTESYRPGGTAITLRLKERVVPLKRDGNTLTAGATDNGIVDNLPGTTPPATSPDDVRLTVSGLQTKDPTDDRLTGTFFGQEVELRRDTRAKPPIVLRLPGDRPWVRFMREVLIPKTAEDRETYHRFQHAEAKRFLTSCQLYRTDYWLRKYMKGGASEQGKRSFDAIIRGMNGLTISPRSISSSPFGGILRSNMAPAAMESYALARSGLGMYFSTAAGGAVRIEVTDNRDCVIYYITDRRANSKNGLVVMDTPAHPPLASSFGRWLLDFSHMDYADDLAFSRALLETMVISSSRSANQLTSPSGRSAYTDYLGVMAIEDQRGVMFANDDLSWGYNMTSGSFTALIARALSHGERRTGPDLVAILGDTTKNRNLAQRLELTGREELATQVIVESFDGGPELRPGECSYFDTLNGADDVLAGEGISGGNDFQEGRGMSTLRRLTTKWLREKHPQLVTAAEQSVAMFIPQDELASRSKEDVFHLLCENFFEHERFSRVTPAQGRKIITSAMALVQTIREQSRDLEAFILANGVTKSTEWAPRASGF
jgi:hypothetical protein